MKRHIYFILFALFVSCTPVVEELDKPFLEGQEVTISAIIAEQRPQMLSGMQRVSGKDTDPTNPNNGTIHLTWDEGDRILVKIGDKSSAFTLTSGAGTGSGTFTGIMPAEGASFHVQYPTNKPNLAEQQYVKDGFGKDLMLMTTKQAATINSGFVLSADYALLGLQLTGDRVIGKIVLSKNNADGKAGDETYTLHCPGVTLSATPTLFYIVVLPNTWANGFTVEVFGSDNSTIVDTFVKTTSITFGTTNATVMPTKPVQSSAKRIGVFSVAEDKQVSFSQGNLQYIQSQNKWQFAENQWEYTGKRHIQKGQLADTIMYFGWSAKDSNAPWGISLSTDVEDYKGEFLDWGVNIISGDAANTWRTLSNDEWIYICQGRKNAAELLGLGMIEDIRGLIILPDNCELPQSLSFTPNTNDATINQYTYEQWDELENIGVIFIPPTGYFNHLIDDMRYVGVYGYARNNTLTAEGLQIYTLFTPTEIQYSRSAQGSNGNLYYAFPQRLVHDTIPPFAPKPVDLGLSVLWATCNVGATSPEEYGDYFAWGETEPKEEYGWSTYKWCDGTGTNMTKYNATDGLTTLLPEDDAARVNWGGQWRMPSEEEMSELVNNCIWELTSKNSINGYQITSKVEGYTDKSIFWPCAGYLNHDLNNIVSTLARYWANNCNGSNACNLYEYETLMYNTRRCGCSIRPVLPKN